MLDTKSGITTLSIGRTILRVVIFPISTSYMDQDETKVKKMKYILYRSFGDLDKDIKKHELVAVEIGGSIDEVTNALIKDVAEDLAEMPEYAHCEIAAYAPELIHNFRRVKRYQYEMQGMVSPPRAKENILIDYGIVETEE